MEVHLVKGKRIKGVDRITDKRHGKIALEVIKGDQDDQNQDVQYELKEGVFADATDKIVIDGISFVRQEGG